MPSPVSNVRIRRATPEDAGICGRIMFEAFAGINTAHGFPSELPGPDSGAEVLGMLFSNPSFHCVVAELDGRIVGSNCLDERSRVAGLGPVSVEPGSQNEGLGRPLMAALLDRVREKQFAGVRLLQSSFHGRSMASYAKLGFVVREPFAAMSGLPSPGPLAGYSVREAVESDVPACSDLCAQVHGFPRDGELRDAVAQGAGRVVERQGRLTGYACGFGYFGQAVAETTDDLKALLLSANAVAGPAILIPTRNAELFRWCLESGMRIFQPMTLMTIGLYNEPRGAYLPSVLY